MNLLLLGFFLGIAFWYWFPKFIKKRFGRAASVAKAPLTWLGKLAKLGTSLLSGDKEKK